VVPRRVFLGSLSMSIKCIDMDSSNDHTSSNPTRKAMLSQARGRGKSRRKIEGVHDINPRWLSLTQACRYASMSHKTFMRYVTRCDVYGTKKGGKWYIDRFSIDLFFSSDEIFVLDAVARLGRKVT